ncbi:MAG: tRNA 2-thiouridine(34) synthase MnmA, partial [Atopobium sp.]|nr:tRNA 2-thiouridine(34) synthase MnmA [Atopobium sp.]
FIEFDQPVKTVAAGQSAVLYDGQEVCGGGIIEADKGILEQFM